MRFNISETRFLIRFPVLIRVCILWYGIFKGADETKMAAHSSLFLKFLDYLWLHCSVETDNELTLYSWAWGFEALLTTPDEARGRAAILPDAIRNDFLGYEQANYEQYNSGTETDAVFALVAKEKRTASFCRLSKHSIPGARAVPIRHP